MRAGLKYGLLSTVAGAIVVADQLTKFAVQRTMHLYETVPIIDGFFHFTYIRNPGAAFGMFAHASGPFRFVFFLLTSMIALGLLSVIFYRLPKDDWSGHVSVAAILGGAFGNLIDRVRYGEVIDFLDVFIRDHHWPAFNVADSAISLGVVALIVNFARGKTPPQAALPSHAKG